MAKHVILESYSFTPSTRTVVVTGKNIRSEQLLLITNVTAGTVIYNFSDPSLGFTSLTNSVSTVTGLETCTIVLAYNTSSMASTDKLSLLVEESYQEIIPAETFRDPVDKLRVSEPQALTDTDFEYGPQPTKWEAISLSSNRPTAFYDTTAPLGFVSNVTSNYFKTVTVACANTVGLSVGQPIFIQGTLDVGNADGWWIIDTLSANTSFTYNTVNPVTSSQITGTNLLYDATKTYIFPANYYTGAGIPVTSIIVNSTANVTVNTANSHSLSLGDHVFVANTTGVSGVNGSWVVSSTPTSNSFIYTANASLTGTVTLAGGTNSTLYSRPMGYVEHRPYDGGVQFTNQLSPHGYQVIRQTRRQFRYQSGKGIQFSTGSILKPSLFVDNISSNGSVATVTTRFPHGLSAGANIRVSGAVESGYNGFFTVASSANNINLTYATTASAGTATGFPITVSPNSWYGSSNRVGMFDSQNGFYFEFDGQTLYCVKRSSTQQISGSSTVTQNSNTITGYNTKYSSQLTPGDFIVIRGMSYLVQSIISDTQMLINPEYRGTAATNCLVSKTINTRFPQSQWNIDKCDGTGPSQYNLDLTKMQMFYADYSWYGAGAIRFGFKNNRGEVIYCHRITNNNLNTEAYMRSGNLPARYETNTFAPYTILTSSLLSSATTGATISLADASLFPSSGTVVLQAPGNTTANIEYITYSAKNTANTALTIASRAANGGRTTAADFIYSATAPTQIQLASPQCASTISHWGSSVIMDGKFDDDKSYVFNAGMLTNLSNQTSGVRMALMSIRLAPSVDNGLTGLLGAREIINRMQLTLRGIDTYTTGNAYRIELILNGRVASGTYQPLGGSSLAQIAYHAANVTISGGESIYGFFTNASGATSQDLTLVRDIGNSIMGGGTSLTCPNTFNNLYPDGPDVLIVAATALGPVNTINARISWTEAQA